jgi:hypothetical protein
MGLFSRDYDYDHGYRANREGGRSYWSRSGRPIQANYGGDYGDAGRGGWGPYRNAGTGYGDDFRTGYDRSYKSRWQTDYGDPFNDRDQRTPMRVIRGESRGYDASYFDNRYDSGFRGGPTRYDDTYRGNSDRFPMGYRTNTTRGTYDQSYNSRAYRPNRSANDGWF